MRCLIVTLFTAALVLTLLGCDPRYGPGDRPSDMAGTVVQTGENISLSSLKGKWVLLDFCENSGNTFLGPGDKLEAPHLDKMIKARWLPINSRIQLIHVAAGASSEELAEIATRTHILEPVVHIYETGNWGEWDSQRDFLISPSGQVVLAEPQQDDKLAPIDWGKLVQPFLDQADDFSPARVSNTRDWNTESGSLDFIARTYLPSADNYHVELVLKAYASQGEENQDGQLIPLVSLHNAWGVSSGGEAEIPVKMTGLTGCDFATYELKLLDPRIGIWVTRSGFITADEKEASQQPQSNADYDSSYRKPAGQSGN